MCCIELAFIHHQIIIGPIDDVVCVLLQHELGNTEKPEEIFDIIEHFCLGRRRLHLFGTDATIRPGISPYTHFRFQFIHLHLQGTTLVVKGG